eukprot:CAMPEP_0198152006 /NCGR_PEP_ID=MMETSP1443-20131203/58079_1 /TAXON_ID=186043 /ORGANISM="Entomoneis sp., Strain CCMP2396" /LENGTH=89 /DNA_ID=CAMNT_0043817877 /DNA_START=107 /DNA_END=379 /DNA_ORIENTATION=-
MNTSEKEEMQSENRTKKDESISVSDDHEKPIDQDDENHAQQQSSPFAESCAEGELLDMTLDPHEFEDSANGGNKEWKSEWDMFLTEAKS